MRPGIPDVSQGFQLHYGPETYDDPIQVARFVLQPGEEANDCLTRTTPNEDDVLYGHYSMRMRPGAHHLVVLCTTAESPDGELSACNEGAGILGPGCWLFSSQGSLGESSGEDFPPLDSAVPRENQGIGFSLGHRTRVRYNMHFLNTTEEPILRESWTNVYYANAGEVTQIAAPIVFAGGIRMNVLPRSNQTIHVSCALPSASAGAVRVLDLVSHTHSHDLHFSAVRVDAPGNRTALYDSYNWQEPLHAYFDAAHLNALPNASAKLDGAVSGDLILSPGDTISYDCDIRNDLDTALTFSNQVNTGEMCNLFGTYTPSTGAAWGCVAP